VTWKAHYRLACPICGGSFEDGSKDFLLTCPEPHAPALLRAVYDEKRLVIHPEHTGVFRYADWLPVRRVLHGAAGPVAWHSTRLGHRLGLDSLYIVFSGWWPEKGARMETCTFKDLEAQAVGARMERGSALVVASAGNTARAFHHVCSTHGLPALIVVPGYSVPMLWGTVPPGPGVRLAVLEGEADYTDAIEMAGRISALDGFTAEGGARNAARRDGMGAALLAAVEAAGRIPDAYVQAVGSGTGAIAAWEMSLRLAGDGRYGEPRMRLHLGQNAAFAPMVDAWQAGTREIADAPGAREIAAGVHAHVLANRKPPYGIAGGLYDALSDTGGTMYRVDARSAIAAGHLFAETEGIDIDPAAEIAVASLLQGVDQGTIGRADVVVLNITGGGQRGLQRDKPTSALKPDIVLVRGADLPMEALV
jgi:cysteate synthase